MKTREQALNDLGSIVAAEIERIDSLTPEEAARQAWRPGGPSEAELADRLRTLRARRSQISGDG